MQNNLINLNNHLFAQLERLSDEDLQGDKLVEEINRSKAVTDVAVQIIANGNLVLKAQMASCDMNGRTLTLPKFIGAGGE